MRDDEFAPVSRNKQISGTKAGAIVYAKDLLRAVDFYKHAAGLAICDKGNDYVQLESDGFQLLVLQAPKDVAGSISVSEPPIRREGTPIKLVFFESIAVARESVQHFGGRLKGKSKEWEFDKHKVCDGYDVERNVF